LILRSPDLPISLICAYLRSSAAKAFYFALIHLNKKGRPFPAAFFLRFGYLLTAIC
jgi:hypothetical protein